jgi:hypothetical protein
MVTELVNHWKNPASGVAQEVQLTNRIKDICALGQDLHICSHMENVFALSFSMFSSKIYDALFLDYGPSPH